MIDDLQKELLEQEDTQKDKFLIFMLDSEHYAIEIRYVTEIIGMQVITEVPEMPDYIKGIINLRGKIIPVMDVRLRFRKVPMAYNDRTCVIVIDIDDISIGLIVDRVSEVLSIPEQEIVPPPGVKEGGSRFIKGVGKAGNEVKLILNCDKLLGKEEAESLSNIQ